ncbi:MAG: hypothetical protein C0491_02500 [Novosphingobium sp.]|nr:hypothetical protein [Novosphingobium sp.]
MTDTIPDWAGKRACELLNAEYVAVSYYKWPRDKECRHVTTVAKLVMQHETAPVDPDEEAVKRIFGRVSICLATFELAAAVSQYKQEKANG